jgi:protein-disulfide isomerase
MTARGIWDVVSAAIVAVAAVTMLGFYLYDRADRVADAPERHAQDWEEWAESGIRVGPEDATMVVATFIDLTCPFCRTLAPVLDSVLTEFEGDAALEFHHFPLRSHEFALPAAIAAECAERQGRFIQMYHTLYALSDSVGKKPWGALAAEAGVDDIPAFEACTQLPADAFDRIGDGLALAGRIGVIATPTVYVNGTLLNGRSVAAFRGMAEELGVVR